MALEVVWSPEALDDVDDIAAYITRDSAAYAAAVVDRVIDAARHLSEHPFVGRVVPELGDRHFRERFVYSYRVIYRVDERRVLVVAVIHGKRLLEVIDERLR